MKLENTMVWWGHDEKTAEDGGDEIRILDTNVDGNEKYSYLMNSNGACYGGWRSMGPRKQAASLMAIVFCAITKEGVSASMAHDEMMKIDEYREFNDNFEGPFADVYRGDE